MNVYAPRSELKGFYLARVGLCHAKGDVFLPLARAHSIGAFNPSHFADGFGPVFLAMCMHYNIPDAIQPMRNKNAAGLTTYTALTGMSPGVEAESLGHGICPASNSHPFFWASFAVPFPPACSIVPIHLLFSLMAPCSFPFSSFFLLLSNPPVHFSDPHPPLSSCSVVSDLPAVRAGRGAGMGEAQCGCLAQLDHVHELRGWVGGMPVIVA